MECMVCRNPIQIFCGCCDKVYKCWFCVIYFHRCEDNSHIILCEKDNYECKICEIDCSMIKNIDIFEKYW
jgi:hypothetical protein